MTRTEAEQAMIAAARELRQKAHLFGIASPPALAARDALNSAIDALDALPPAAPEPVGKVVEVRAGVYYHRASDTFSINGVRWPDGTWGISESSELVATIRARVPLPVVPEVVGEVEG